LFLTFLSLYAWNLFLYDKYGGIGRYQAQTAIGKGAIDTKTGNLFMPVRPSSALDAERWYSIEPITLEKEGNTFRLLDRGRALMKAGFTTKEALDFVRLLESRRTGRERRKRPKTGLTRKELLKSHMMEQKEAELKK